MKRIVLTLALCIGGNAFGDCLVISKFNVEQRFSNGEYLIQYRNGWEGLLAGQQHPKYDFAVLKLDHGGFKATGIYNGRVFVNDSEKTTITLDGFDKKVPYFKETKNCK
jgi:hypothetical protein